jgi:hypothetical protein
MQAERRKKKDKTAGSADTNPTREILSLSASEILLLDCLEGHPTSVVLFCLSVAKSGDA